MNNKPTSANTWRMPAVAATLLLVLIFCSVMSNAETNPPKKAVTFISAPAKTSIHKRNPADTQNKKSKVKKADTIAVQSPARHKVKKTVKAQSGVTLPTVAPVITPAEPVTKTAVMESTTPLDESIVMDYAAKKKAAHPKNGWDSFQKYINDKAVSADGKTGTVELSFTVNSKGVVNDDVKITKSLSNAADKTAIDLIKNGPPWDDTDTDTEPVIIKVQFH